MTGRNLFSLALLFGLAVAAVSPALASPPQKRGEPASAKELSDPDKLPIVDCTLPPQMRQLGRQRTYMGRPRPVRTSGVECEIRGGEYVAYDRADLATALSVWLERAEAGNAEAQNYVGEIYERGLGVPPDHGTAATWYRRAADQGFARSQINYGNLLEKGLGVAEDKLEALKWYRAAAGISGAIALDGFDQIIDLEEVERLRTEVAALDDEKEQLERSLVELGGQLAESQAALEVQQEEQARLAATLQEREQQLAAVVASDQAEIERLGSEITALREQLTEVSAEAQLVEARVTESRDALVASGVRTSELDGLAGGLRGRLEQFQQLQARQSEQILQASGSIAGPSIEVIAPALRVEDRSRRALRREPGAETRLVGRVTAPAGLDTFSVNEQPQRVDPSGRFTVALAELLPAAQVRLVAADSQGKSSALDIDLQNSSARSQAGRRRVNVDSFGSYHALIIANHQYDHQPDLGMALKDAQQLAELLGSRYGFSTQVLENVDRAQLLGALYQVNKDLPEESSLLIYYSGHSELDAESGQGYWLPPRATSEYADDWISITMITDYLDVLRSAHVLVVADSVYPGTTSRSAVARIEEATGRETQRRLREIAGKRSRTELVSGQEQPVVGNGERPNSVFGEALLAALWNNGIVLEAQRLFREVATRVSYAVATVGVEGAPNYAPIQFAGHEAGDFLFVPR